MAGRETDLNSPEWITGAGRLARYGGECRHTTKEMKKAWHLVSSKGG
jgi:hypothetical protein